MLHVMVNPRTGGEVESQVSDGGRPVGEHEARGPDHERGNDERDGADATTDFVLLNRSDLIYSSVLTVMGKPTEGPQVRLPGIPR